MAWLPAYLVRGSNNISNEECGQIFRVVLEQLLFALYSALLCDPLSS